MAEFEIPMGGLRFGSVIIEKTETYTIPAFIKCEKDGSIMKFDSRDYVCKYPGCTNSIGVFQFVKREYIDSKLNDAHKIKEMANKKEISKQQLEEGKDALIKQLERHRIVSSGEEFESVKAEIEKICEQEG